MKQDCFHKIKMKIKRQHKNVDHKYTRAAFQHMNSDGNYVIDIKTLYSETWKQRPPRTKNMWSSMKSGLHFQVIQHEI